MGKTKNDSGKQTTQVHDDIKQTAVQRFVPSSSYSKGVHLRKQQWFSGSVGAVNIPN